MAQVAIPHGAVSDAVGIVDLRNDRLQAGTMCAAMT